MISAISDRPGASGAVRRCTQPPQALPLSPSSDLLQTIFIRQGPPAKCRGPQPVEKEINHVCLHGHAPGRQTPLQQKGDFECTKCMKNSLFAPDCARRRVQRPTAAQRRLLGRRKRELRETNKRLRSEVFIGSPQNGAKRNFVGKRKNDGTV